MRYVVLLFDYTQFKEFSTVNGKRAYAMSQVLMGSLEISRSTTWVDKRLIRDHWWKWV